MDAVKNPYVPSAGRTPPALAGRASLLETATVNSKRLLAGRHVNGILYIGLRGVGKTVLLNRVAEDAQTRGIVCLQLEMLEKYSLPSLLVPELRKTLTALDPYEKARGYVMKAWHAFADFLNSVRVKYEDVTVRLEIDGGSGIANTGKLETDLPDLLCAIGEAAKEKKTAIAIFIDELQYVKESQLAALITALHKCQQKQRPVTVIGAGLPQLIRDVGKAKSYAERLFEFSEIGKLDDEAARYAIQDPAEREGVSFEAPALREILSQTQGYPYFLQEWGSQSWLVAKGETITLSDVETATVHALDRLDVGFFRVRYDRCTPREREYLRAMAELGSGPHKSREIAARMNKDVRAVAPRRGSLIAKGMIYSPKHGDTAFTVPLFDEFMQRAMPPAGSGT